MLTVWHPTLARDFQNDYLFKAPAGFTDEFIFPASVGDFVSVGTDADLEYFQSEEDGAPIVRTFNNFTLNAGHHLRPTKRCKGLYLNILGDLIVDGSLSMSERGCKGPGKYIGIAPHYKRIYFADSNIYRPDDFIVIPAYGLMPENGNRNYPGIDGGCGSGGGAGTSPTSGVRGGQATSFSGGAGAGGGCAYNTGGGSSKHRQGSPGEDNGGAGGAGYRYGGAAAAYGGGGGAGNPGGTCHSTDRHGQSGTGGLMILFVQGNIIFGESGYIASNGSSGGGGENGRTNVRYRSFCGSGSGGGAIHIFHKGALNRTDRITVAGGVLVPNGSDSNALYNSPGGDGTINLYQL